MSGDRCDDQTKPKTDRVPSGNQNSRTDQSGALPTTQGPLVLVAALVTVVLWASAFIGPRGAGPTTTPAPWPWPCCAWWWAAPRFMRNPAKAGIRQGFQTDTPVLRSRPGPSCS